ncbi:ubiquitin-specific protease doa4 [Saitoella coloradoensis]
MSPVTLAQIVERARVVRKDEFAVRSYTNVAMQCLENADKALAQGRHEEAYEFYLKASNILLDTIPGHKQFATLTGLPLTQYFDVRQKMNTRYSTFSEIKEQLKAAEPPSLPMSPPPAEVEEPKRDPLEEKLERLRRNGVNTGSAGRTDTPAFKPKAPSPAISTLPIANDIETNLITARESSSSTKSSLTADMIIPPFRGQSTASAVKPSSSAVLGTSNGDHAVGKPRPSVPHKPAYLHSPVSAQSPTFPTPPPLHPIQLPSYPTQSHTNGKVGGLNLPRILTDARFPKANVVDPETLLGYTQRTTDRPSILFLDVRTREDFEASHVSAEYIVNIEPLVLREGMSGQRLEDALVLNPHHEIELFSRRNEFDLVVYYDDDSRSLNARPELTALNTAIYELAHWRKYLVRSPLLLVGGLSAWKEAGGLCVGGALKSEQTGGSAGSAGSGSLRRSPVLPYRIPEPRQERSRSRPPVPRPIEMIDVEKEKRWMAELQSPNNPIAVATSPEHDRIADYKKRNRNTAIVATGEDENVSPYARTVQDFFAKYPSIAVDEKPPPPYSLQPGGERRESRTKFDYELPKKVHSVPEPTERPGYGLRRQSTFVDHPFQGFAEVTHPEFQPPTPTRAAPQPDPELARARGSTRDSLQYPVMVTPRAPSEGRTSKEMLPMTAMTPAAAPRLPSQAPMQTVARQRMSSYSGDTNYGTTGLKNLGNSCFMNCILQCVSGTTPFTRYFYNGSYKNHISKTNPLGTGGQVVSAWSKLVRHLWTDSYNFVSPVTFRDTIGKVRDEFASGQQQDAQEFMQFFLDALHEDLNVASANKRLPDLTPEEEAFREQLPVAVAAQYEWNRYRHRNESLVTNLFQGQFCNRLRCHTCGHTSTTYNSFMYLSLPILVRKGNKISTLRDCLDGFVHEEVMAGDDAWNCPRCKKPRKATKQMTIVRLPTILIIHFKRFIVKGRWTDKLNAPVQYPMRDLDLSAYVPSTDNVPNSDAPPPPHVYNLYAVTNHFGTLNSGHYTAYVLDKSKNRWNLFDDTKVTSCDESQVISPASYILFYVRQRV